MIYRAELRRQKRINRQLRTKLRKLEYIETTARNALLLAAGQQAAAHRALYEGLTGINNTARILE